MNPQQFGNMGGMGRGMPTMGNMGMMGGNMGNPGNMGMNTGMPTMGGMQEQRNHTYLARIYQSLTNSQSQDGPPQGWRANLSIQDRAGQVKFLFDSLRMLGSNVDTLRSLDIALAFEKRQFAMSQSADQYKAEIRQKLASIRDQRQQNAANGMMNVGMNPNMPQQQMPPNMNQGMSGFGNLNMGTPQMPGQQMGQQQGNVINAMNTHQNANPPMQPNNPNQPVRRNPTGLTDEDNKWINTRAAEMAKSTTRDQMAQLVDSMEPGVRAHLNEKGIDPIIYHFRMKATKEFRMRQTQNAQNVQNAQTAMAANMNRIQTPNPTATVPVTQPNQTPFLGNIDQFRGQQEEGMRSQQEGQLVVPASTSNPNMGVTNDPAAQQQRMLLMQLRHQNPNASQNELRQLLIQKTRELQARNQAQRQLNAQAQMMQGQNLTNGVPQPRGINTLNQPLNQSLSLDNNAQNIQMPVSRPQSAQMVNKPQQQQAPSVQAILANFSTFPPQVQALLNAQPRSEWPAFIMAYRNRQEQRQAQMQAQQQQQQQHAQQQQRQQQQQQQVVNNNMQRSVSQQPQSLQANQNLGQMPNQFAGPSMMQPSLSAGAEGSSLSNMKPQMQQQAMSHNAQNAIRMQQQQQQQMAQQNASGQQMQTQGQNNTRMNEMLVKESMNRALPGQIREKLDGFYKQNNVVMPPTLQTWAALRTWMRSHGGINPPITAIDTMQLNHARALRQAQQAQQAQAQAHAQAQQQAQMAGAGQPMQQNSNGLQILTMPQQGPGVGVQQARQVTSQAVQEAKKRNPNWQNLSDQQVKQILEERSQKSQPISMPNQPQNQSLAAPQLQNNVVAMNQQRTGQPAHQQNRPVPQNQFQTQQHPGTSAKHGEPKSLKRPNQDDTQEVPQVQQSMPQGHGLTKEEFEKLTPEKKAQFIQEQREQQERRKQEAARRVAEVSKEVTAGITPMPPNYTLDQATRQKLINKLTEPNTRKIVERFDSLLLTVAQVNNDTEQLKQLIRYKWHLVQQYKPESFADKTYQPADHFTLTPENLDRILVTVTKWFQQAMAKSSNNAMTQAQQSMPLTQENLNMAAQQAAQQQKAKGQKSKDGPPPAPTADKPPFAFPTDRGHGTPKYAGSGLKPEDLRLPPKKKPRGDNAASPITQSPVPQPKVLLKCNFPGCNVQPQGFATEADLDIHRNTIHKPEMESVKDPVGFLNTSLQQAFHLDEDMLPRKVPSGAKSMERTLSQNIKGESRAATPVGMIRTGSQLAGKVTPLQQKVKQGVPAPSAGPNTEDQWSESAFSWDDLNTVFGPTDAGDLVPTTTDSLNLLDKTLAAYMKTEDYKRVFGESDVSEKSSAKSKSPDQGSEPSLPEKSAQKDHGLYHVDLDIDGTDALPDLPDAFDGLFDDKDAERWTLLDNEGSTSSFEMLDKNVANESQPVTGASEFDLSSWIQDDEIDPLVHDILDTPTNWEELYASGPANYAGGSLAWNATGKAGQEMRRKLGWPIEGVAGQANAKMGSARA